VGNRIIEAGETSNARYLKIDLGSDATGDTYYRNSSGNTDRLTIGSTDQQLIVASGLPSWSSKHLLNSVSSSTAGGTITLDMNNQVQRVHVGSASFAGSKTLALSNASNALIFGFHFTVTNVAATLVCPASFTMSSVDWNSGSDTWTPPATGDYEMTGMFDGTSWRVNVAGPYN